MASADKDGRAFLASTPFSASTSQIAFCDPLSKQAAVDALAPSFQISFRASSSLLNLPGRSPGSTVSTVASKPTAENETEPGVSRRSDCHFCPPWSSGATSLPAEVKLNVSTRNELPSWLLYEKGPSLNGWFSPSNSSVYFTSTWTAPVSEDTSKNEYPALSPP